MATTQAAAAVVEFAPLGEAPFHLAITPYVAFVFGPYAPFRRFINSAEHSERSGIARAIFSTLANGIRNIRAPPKRDFSTFVDANRNLRAPFGQDLSALADAIRNVRLAFGRDLSTLADAIRNVQALLEWDCSMLLDRFATPRRRSAEILRRLLM